MLNILWPAFFLLAAIAALGNWWQGDAEVFTRMMTALFDMAKTSIEICIALAGSLALWMGFLMIAERAGLMNGLARLLAPLFRRLMPEVPAGHPALGLLTMNCAANVLGLDNAATPIGLKAMRALQELNPTPDTATNAQILFLVLNASSLTLLPVTIFVYRAQQGAADPAAVFLPILLATSASSLAGLFAVAVVQRLKFDWVMWGYVLAIGAVLAMLMSSLATLPAALLTEVSSLTGNLVLFSILLGFLSYAFYRKIAVYDAFIEGAKGGFEIAIQLLPYLVAMLAAIGVLRASGALDWALSGIRYVVTLFNGDIRFVDALPTALIKPFSGSGARAMMIETMKNFGVDSFPARLAAVIQGSTETTFYVLAVYFGAVGVRYTRHAIPCALFADLCGVLAAIAVCYWFFG